MSWKVAGADKMQASPAFLMGLLLPRQPETVPAVASVPAASSVPAGPTQDPITGRKSKTKRGRLSKEERELWTESTTETLYVTAKDEFKRARNHVQIGAASGLIKLLKKKWSLYRRASMLPEMSQSLRLYRNTSLCDGSTAHEDADSDSVSFRDDTAASNRNKRKRANCECVKEELRALADGVKVMDEIMKSKSSTASDPALFRDVVAPLSRQENALNLQTAAINEWIQTLRNKN
ncbi:hypothetical protein GN244_ATG17055 [Phytophthora infestans]|uniref:Uncharacterized protein n=1 Tax=Phytophthora infestans TaxID=4787 RepID=A0A833SPC1_PHYIN|nr:hypothetical protein GN244_ATG17055 [Phytophthora infestans]